LFCAHREDGDSFDQQFCFVICPRAFRRVHRAALIVVFGKLFLYGGVACILLSARQFFVNFDDLCGKYRMASTE
jgi:hypothetical protein